MSLKCQSPVIFILFLTAQGVHFCCTKRTDSWNQSFWFAWSVQKLLLFILRWTSICDTQFFHPLFLSLLFRYNSVVPKGLNLFRHQAFWVQLECPQTESSCLSIFFRWSSIVNALFHTCLVAVCFAADPMLPISDVCVVLLVTVSGSSGSETIRLYKNDWRLDSSVVLGTAGESMNRIQLFSSVVLWWLVVLAPSSDTHTCTTGGLPDLFFLLCALDVQILQNVSGAQVQEQFSCTNTTDFSIHQSLFGTAGKFTNRVWWSLAQPPGNAWAFMVLNTGTTSKVLISCGLPQICVWFGDFVGRICLKHFFFFFENLAIRKKVGKCPMM